MGRKYGDWHFFQLTKHGEYCIKDNFLSYKLIGDCAYSMGPWIYNSFKGCV